MLYGAFSLMEATLTDYEVEVFYDGACPLCLKEMQMLRRRDQAGRIRFTDIADPSFDAGAIGLSWETLMSRIHGRLPDGTVIEGVEVFRRLYAAVGFATLAKLSRAPGVSHLLELGYRLFAKNRLRLTGRCSDGACEVHRRPPPRPGRTAADGHPPSRPAPGPVAPH